MLLMFRLFIILSAVVLFNSQLVQSAEFSVDSFIPSGKSSGHAILGFDTVKAINVAYRVFEKLRKDDNSYQKVIVRISEAMVTVSFIPKELGLDDPNIVKVVMHNPSLEIVDLEWKAGKLFLRKEN